ncbi:MAG: M23 family metallopeptidase [Gammaproteobacteria bacterium]|nr:M23 family metallopeptidase [Gammaproteobacteria bacterium]
MIKVRTADRHGAGHFHAKRGDHKHQGIDIVIHGGEAVCSLQNGEVTRLGYCYNAKIKGNENRGHFRLIEITDDNHNRWRYLYTSPLVDVGDIVERGQVIGAAQGLDEAFPGIIDHYHFEIMPPGGWKEPCIDPVPVLKELGYEFV